MILVTGGTGLVGSHLLYALACNNKKVRALLRPGARPYQTEHLFKCFSPTDNQLLSHIEWVEGDVLDQLSLHEAMQGVEYVYHCAAMISFSPSDLKTMLAVNIDGTANVVNACLQNNIKKLCHVSSIASLGRPEADGFIDENAKWKTSKSNSGYAISKYGGEREVWRGIEEGLNAVIVNPSIILGAGCHAKATNRLFLSIKKFLPFYTHGINGYVDVSDVVKSMIMLMESDISGERFVLNSENISLKQLFITAADILGKPHPRIKLNKQLMYVLAAIDETRSKITGSRALITRENVSAALAKSEYSAEKIKSRFGYSFLSVEDSLRNAFKILEQHK